MTYENDNREWINKQVLNFEDKVYQTGGYISVDISSFTSNNGVTFSTPKIQLRLRNLDGKTRSYSLGLSETMDLLLSLNNAGIRNPNLFCKQGENNEVYKRGYNISLKIFGLQKDEINLIILKIIINDSDQGKIAIPYITFMTILKILSIYQDNYFNLSNQLEQKYFLNSMNIELKSISNNIKILPSLINDRVNVINEIVQDTPVLDQTIEDFKEFVDEKINSPEISERVPEINFEQTKLNQGEFKESTVKQNIRSKFFEDVLSNDIQNFENKMISIHSSPGCTILNFISSIKESMNFGETFSYLPNISDNDMKILALVSQVNFKTELQGWTQTDQNISSSFGILRYDTGGLCKIENVELAYDLLTIMSYIHRVREKLESKDTNAQTNKAILYVATRCFIDPLIFSFIIDKPIDIIKTCVINRYKYYKEKGFFKKFDDLLNDEINIQEISNFVDRIGDTIQKTITIEQLYKKAYNRGDYKIPYKNDMKLEQIVKEQVDFHVQKRLHPELNNDIGPQKIQHKKQSIRYNSNIHRVLNEVDFKKLIPESFRDLFLEQIASLKNENYNYVDKKFPIEEFGDDVVKSLYVWNESNKNESYSTFRDKLEQCIMTKNMIITKIKGLKNIEDKVNGIDESFDFSTLKLEL
jgi:hypothetical protein